MPHLLPLSLKATLALTVVAGLTATAPIASAAQHHAGRTQTGAKADLVVRDVDIEVGDDAMAITGTVKNIGLKRATRSDLVVAVSADTTLDESDDIVDETSVRREKPGRARDFDLETDLPSEDDLPEGDAYLLVCADGDDAVAERNERNNCAAYELADDATPVTDDAPGSSDDPAGDGATAPGDDQGGDDQGGDQASADGASDASVSVSGDDDGN